MAKEDYYDHYDEELTETFETEVAPEDYVNEDEVNEDSFIQHQIDEKEEQALIEQAEEEALIDAMEEDRLIAEMEEQAVIEAYIERQYIEQCLSEQSDEEAMIDAMQEEQLIAGDEEEAQIDNMQQQQEEDLPDFPSSVNPSREEQEEDDDEQDDLPMVSNDESKSDNDTHRIIKLLMMRKAKLDIKVKKKGVEISSFGVARLKYRINDESWHWILAYLETGGYEDYGISSTEVSDIDCEVRLKELKEQGCNPDVLYDGKTDAYIGIMVHFKYGNLFFYIKRSDEFINYLIENKLWLY